MIELKEWIKDGINIRTTNKGYQVFTIPTQHFDINDFLTIQLFGFETTEPIKWYFPGE